MKGAKLGWKTTPGFTIYLLVRPWGKKKVRIAEEQHELYARVFLLIGERVVGKKKNVKIRDSRKRKGGKKRAATLHIGQRSRNRLNAFYSGRKPDPRRVNGR